MRPLALALALQTAPPVDVTWQGEPTCPVAHFDARLAAYLAGTRGPRPVRVAVDITHDTRWTADLALTTDSGRTDRRLQGNSCHEVADAAAFVTAVVVDPGVLARPHPDDPAPITEPIPDPPPQPPEAVVPDPPPADPPVAASPPPSAPPRERPPRRPRTLGGFVRPTGGFEALGLPKLAPTASLAAGLLAHRWRLELAATYRAPTSAQNPDIPDVGARIRLWTAAARGCGVLRPSVLEIPLCAGVEAGQAIAEGFGLEDPLTKREPWVAALVGPALAWAPRRWLALWLGVEVGVPLITHPFGSEGLATPHFRIRYISLRAGLGLELRIF